MQGDPTASLPCAWGGPVLSGLLKQRAEDFDVREELGYAPDGAGEHDFLVVRKREHNTHDVARLLARHAGVKQVAVGYAGLKDRNAVTTQAFSVQLPGRASPDWHALDNDRLQILSVARHSRKIRRGALRGNAFRIRVRAAAGERGVTEGMLRRIADAGVPNYFGAQRFGRRGQNLERATAMFAGQGRRPGREQRGMLLSAVRAAMFNQVLAERVRDGSWAAGRAGDVMQLDGGRAQFAALQLDPELRARLARGEIHPTGPLFGDAGRALCPQGEVETLERRVAADRPDWVDGLRANRLDADRRALRLQPRELAWDWEDDTLLVRFALPAGAYATTLLRELVVEPA